MGLLDSLENKSETRIYESRLPSLQSHQDFLRLVVHLSNKHSCTRWYYSILITLSPIQTLLISC